jgi:methionine-rich copper-binding protein CopC
MLLLMKNNESQTKSLLASKSNQSGGLLLAPLIIALLVWSNFSAAQHTHGVLSPSVTFPQDDSVLTEEPKMITMSFRVDVKLLKLALYTDSGEWINIEFIYDPTRVNHNFVFPLPGEFPVADYYIARWSVVDERQRFLNGEFTFSFGPGAIPPSETIEASYRSIEEENLPSTGAYAQGSNR